MIIVKVNIILNLWYENEIFDGCKLLVEIEVF